MTITLNATTVSLILVNAAIYLRVAYIVLANI